MKQKIFVTLNVNEEEIEISISPNKTLLDVLREDLELTGTKEGCGEGVCGSCTVLCDGLPIRSCLTLAAEVQGKKILTIEGLATGEEGLDTLQQSFIDHGAVQCGYCTNGMIMSAKALLNYNTSPSEAEVRKGISGNICRCTGYQKMVEAILDVSEGGEEK
ncbi:(2Fe-2S)-binding protein [Thermodesulfobacteriota bacterium]